MKLAVVAKMVHFLLKKTKSNAACQTKW